MKILICDDELQFLNDIQRQIQEYMNSHSIVCEFTTTTDPTAILNGDEVYNLAFLDIQMESVDGISLAKELKRRNSKLALFFITNYNEYQDDAMDLRAFRYFEKPLDPSRLRSGLDKAMEYINETYVDLFIQKDGAHRRFLADDIIYIMRDNRKVIVTTTKGQFATPESFDACCQKLPLTFFYTVHKSFFVNLHYVDKYSYSELYLTDGTRIPIASRKQSAFRKAWFDYLRRR